MNYFLAMVLGACTFGIFTLYWLHTYTQRISDESARRNIYSNFGVKTFWLWGVLGSLVYVGPFVYFYKLFEASNNLEKDYNMNG